MIQKSWPGFLCVLLAIDAQAAEKVCDPDFPNRCSQPVSKGEPAPFSGQLITDELAIALGQKADGCERRLEIERERADSLVSGAITLGEERVGICKQAATEAKERLEAAILEQSEPPFWESPWFTVPVTAITTAGVMLGVWWVAIKTVQATK